MTYPQNKTQLIRFLRANPGIYFKVARTDGTEHMRRLSRGQTNAFAGRTANGKESWFYFEKGDTYLFEESRFIVELEFGRLIFDFKPSTEAIEAFEAECKENAA